MKLRFATDKDKQEVLDELCDYCIESKTQFIMENNAGNVRDRFCRGCLRQYIDAVESFSMHNQV